MQKDYQVTIGNVGKVKARVLALDRDIKTEEEEVKQRTADAETLLGQGKEALATRICAKIEAKQQEVDTFKGARKQQKDMLTGLEKTRDQIKDAVDEATNQLKMMKTMQDVTKANESLATVSVSGSKSALASFQERKNKLQARMDESRLINEQQTDSLEDEIDQALDRSKGSDLLAKLKAKQ